MILQALTELYARLSTDPDNAYGLPIPGTSAQRVTFCIVIKPDGTLQPPIQDARVTHHATTKSGKTKTTQTARQLLLPGESKPPGQGINPCTLWDNTAYLLGYKKPDKDPEKAEKEAARAAQTFAASRDHHLALESTINSPAFSAVCRFLQNWTPALASQHTEQLDDFAATGFGVFRILGENRYVHEDPAFQAWWKSTQAATAASEVIAPCLITGEISPIARLHDPAIKGVNGAAPGGAKLASFNLNAFESYGKSQSYNAPVSEALAFRYCNALNALLSGPQSRRHRLQIGDATTLFWTERETITESLFAEFLGGDVISEAPLDGVPATEEDEAKHQRLQAFLQILRQGGGTDVADLGDDPKTRFYVLGLSGNVTRLSVRFWHVGTLAEMVDRLRSHYAALRIVRSYDKDSEFPPLWMLLRQTARETKDIPPLLAGAVMHAILNGTPYPQILYNSVLNRIRADHTINYLRAALIKSVLTRLPNSNHQLTMSLDPDRPDSAYLLGRLFAALEKTQEDAGINATIRQTFYSSASATPGVVFPRLMRTYTHHLAKLERGQRTNRERLVQSIHAPLTGYPTHLGLEDQGIFAIGYYHQRQDFFTKKEKPESS